MTAGNPQGDGSDSVTVGKGGVKRRREERATRGLYVGLSRPRRVTARPVPRSHNPMDPDGVTARPAEHSPNPMDPDECVQAPPAPPD